MAETYFCPRVQVYCHHGVRVPLPFQHHGIEMYGKDDVRHTSYGQRMRESWDRYKGASGLLWLEGDIAIEALHLNEIEQLHHRQPGCVIAVPYRLYPLSTIRKAVLWAHSSADTSGRWQLVSADEPCPSHPAAFALGCTFLPAMLLNEAEAHCDAFDWPVVDTRLSTVAAEHDIPCYTTTTPAVHLHY